MRGYDTADYAASRLVETIIRHNSVPILVANVYGDDNDEIMIRYSSLIDDSEGVIKLSECDLNPVPLGYVNHKNNSHYIMRTPMRRDWRQGLRMLNIVDVEGANPRLIPYRTIAQTIMGKFPSFKNCLEKINTSKTNSIAFSRDFAINANSKLEYKEWVTVGHVNMENGNILIDDDCAWVREALDEQLEAA